MRPEELSQLNLLDIITKYRIVAIFVTLDSQEVVHTYYVGVFMTVSVWTQAYQV